jgi:hypothetical protein
MNHHQAKEELKLIREMIEKTKKSHAESWDFFLMWGILIILAIIGMHALAYAKKFNLIWLNWTVFMGIGGIGQVLFVIRHQRNEKIKTYAQNAVAHISFSCGIAFIFTGFILPLLKIYPVGGIPILVSLIAGIFLFSLGGIYEWTLLKWCGILWWLGALVMIFVHWHYRSLIVIPLIIAGYIIPGLILHARYRTNR